MIRFSLLSRQLQVIGLVSFFIVSVPAHAEFGWLRGCARAVVSTVRYDIGGLAATPLITQPSKPQFGRVSALTVNATEVFSIPTENPGTRAWRTSPHDNIIVVLGNAVRAVCQHVDPYSNGMMSTIEIDEQEALYGEPTGLEDDFARTAIESFVSAYSGRDRELHAQLNQGKRVTIIDLQNVGKKRVNTKVSLFLVEGVYFVLEFERPQQIASENLWFRLQKDVFEGKGPIPKTVHGRAVMPILAGLSREERERYLQSLFSEIQEVISHRIAWDDSPAEILTGFDRASIKEATYQMLRQRAMQRFFEWEVRRADLFEPILPLKQVVAERLSKSGTYPETLSQLLAFIDNTPGWISQKAKLKKAVRENWTRTQKENIKANIPFRVEARSADQVMVTVSGEIYGHSLLLTDAGTIDTDGAKINNQTGMRIEVTPLHPFGDDQPTLRQVQALGVYLEQKIAGEIR